MAGGGVPEHLAATFRKHYARALADAAAARTCSSSPSATGGSRR